MKHLVTLTAVGCIIFSFIGGYALAVSPLNAIPMFGLAGLLGSVSLTEHEHNKQMREWAEYHAGRASQTIESLRTGRILSTTWFAMYETAYNSIHTHTATGGSGGA